MSTTARAGGAAGPTLEDVARVSGVSRATVSRVVRGDVQVTASKVAKVEAAVRKLGYVPHSAARSLASRRTGAVALIVPEHESRVFTDPFFGSAISGVAAALDPTDKQLILVMASSQDDSKLRRFLRGGHADGLLVMSHHEGDLTQELVDDAPVPVVFIGRPSGSVHAPQVDLDNEEGGRLAARHLLATGRTRIATITGPMDMTAAIDRHHGFVSELAAAGCAPVAIGHGDFTIGSGETALAEMMDAGRSFDALFAGSDLMAIGALRRLQLAGTPVPRDVAMVGFDDITAAADPTISLTTVVNPAKDLAERAVRMLVDLIEGEETDRTVIIPPWLRIRGTA
ncbi:MAG TPA: LacI family transcriptional regulator [Candidatus Brachybacterium merdigallinarum]|nr:LacI family transcriptional regulator [Candidatus Brachybacterium merdigallinarum]